VAEPIFFRADVDVAVPRETLWPVVSNTDRLNRAVGLPPVSYAATPDPRGGARIDASARVGPVSLEWEEKPFEWIEPDGFSVQRVFRGGPFEEIRAGCTLAPRDGGTRLMVFAEIKPRGLVGAALARLVGRKSVADLVRFVRRAERAIREGGEPYARRGGRAPVEAAALEAAAGRIDLDGAAARLAPRLVDHLRDAYDEEVVRMRPFALADRWGVERLDVLRLFLAATRAGLLDLKWDLICPHCRGVKAEAEHLGDVPDGGVCDACNERFEVEFDRAVEVRFTVHPSIRRADDRTYCRGGPMNTPHVRAQVRIPAGERHVLEVRLPPDRYVLRSPQAAAPATLDRIERGAPTEAVLVRPEGVLPRACLFTGEAARIEIANESGGEALVVVENAAWDDKAASGALVTSLPEFRDLFGSEALAPGRRLAIRSLAVLFSDLKGSTAMYAEIGDARAYALVREHFDFLAGAIRRRDGSIVKTIGDAVMAVFVSGAAAVEAALEIQSNVERFDREFQAKTGIDAAITVKLGIHRGPMIAVNANEILDYFGTAVNLAARVQGESEGGDVVVTRDLADDPAVRGVIAARGAAAEPFAVALKGFADRFDLVRLRPRA
jgi:class 3 adenylate cyclase/carbon monoxide dehydrogenase subunit G